MSLFIVNFHWQTYSCNISFQAQRLERLRKERQNQIKCKNVQWKDRNTSCSGKRKYLLFSFCFYSCLWWLQHLQFVISPRVFSIEEMPTLCAVLAASPGQGTQGLTGQSRGEVLGSQFGLGAYGVGSAPQGIPGPNPALRNPQF